MTVYLPELKEEIIEFTAIINDGANDHSTQDETQFIKASSISGFSSVKEKFFNFFSGVKGIAIGLVILVIIIGGIFMLRKKHKVRSNE